MVLERARQQQQQQQWKEVVDSSGEGVRVQEMARTAAEVVKELEEASEQQWRGRECSGGGVNCCGGGG